MPISLQRSLSALTLITTLALATALPAHAGEFGDANTADQSVTLSADTKVASRFALTEAGVLSLLRADIDGNGGPQSGFQYVSMDLYQDANGVPGVKLVESEPLKVNAGDGMFEHEFQVNAVPLPAGNYWIVVHSGDTSGIVRDYGDGTPNWYGNADTYSDGPASSFGAGNTGTVTISAGAVYVPGPVHAGTLGRTSIAASPSGGLTTNVMRGSSWGDIAEDKCVITAVWAYLDGKGGGTGSQQVRAAFYGDVGNPRLPALREFQTETVTIPAGMSARWVRLPLKAPMQHFSGFWPGFHLMLQSGDTTGVVRDYGDGPANWLSRPDLFNDGSDLAYDTTKPVQGTVTMSMYMEYEVPNTPTP
jgi:hypothetical protein